MKAGFFLQYPVDISLLQDISQKLGVALVGFYSKEKEGEGIGNSYHYQVADELLVQIQIAYIFLESSNSYEIAANALKRGVYVYLGDLPSYDYNSLLELNDVSFEIGVPVGFGCSGNELVEDSEIVGNYFMIQFTRDAKSTTTDLSFKRMLIYDLASFVRIKPHGLKKLRVDSMPPFNNNPKAINLRLEYDSSSVIAYSITRIDEREGLNLRFFTGSTGYFVNKDFRRSFFDANILDRPNTFFSNSDFINDMIKYTNNIIEKSALSFGLDKALETLSLLGSIEKRIYPSN